MSMFPVGLVTKLGVSTPIVKNGQVIGFYDGWIAKRKFPVDMAGFAVNVQYLLQRPNATMPFRVGYEEDGFMQSLGIKAAEIEPLAFNCTKVRGRCWRNVSIIIVSLSQTFSLENFWKLLA